MVNRDSLNCVIIHISIMVLDKFKKMTDGVRSQVKNCFLTLVSVCQKNHYARGITPKHVTSGVTHFRSSVPRQHRNVAAVASVWRQCQI